MKKKILFVLATVLLLAFVVPSYEGASQTKPKEVKGQKVTKSRGDSKYVVPTGDAPMPKPEKSRGSCCFEFDNATGLYIDIWLDNVYIGRASPWQDSYSYCVGSGYTTYYARSSGGTYEWSNAYDCSGSWVLTLQ